jgi:PIN domain nuclease of toxin-antitoxin system
MKRYVCDTHIIVWHLTEDRRLSRTQRAIFNAVEAGKAQVLVPSIVLVEAVFMLQRRRLPQAILARLLSLPERPTANFCVTPLDLAVAKSLSEFGPAAVPELADRIIAATARALDLPLITVDPAIIESGLVKIVE